MSKNVLIITDYAAPYEGNFIMSLKSLEKEISNSGGKLVYLFINKAKNIDWVKKLSKVYYLENSINKNIKIIKDVIKRENIEILYTHFCLPKTQLAVKVVRSTSKNIKLFSHFHNHYLDSKNLIKRYLIRYAFDGDINIGCSKDVADNLPFKKIKNKYATNAIDFSRLDDFENIKIADKDKFVILMFGYTYKRKGIDLAIEAIKKLNNENIVLAISISKDRKGFEKEIINEFGEIPSFVKILDPRNDIATYYKASDLFLSAAREEGFCYAIIESLYCGIPCICTELPGQPNEIPDLIKVKSENIKELSQAIEKVYNKHNKFDYNKVKNYLVDNYSVEKWSKTVKSIIFEEDTN